MEKRENQERKWRELLERVQGFHGALTLFDWDNETLAPEKASERTKKTVGILSFLYQELLISEETGAVLAEQNARPALDFFERAVLKSLEKERKKLSVIPPEEYRRFSELTSEAVGQWARAKKERDFKIFAPVLEKIVEMKRKFAGYRAEEGKTPYDVLLSDYEEGFTEQALDDFFERLKEKIVPLVKAIREKTEEEPENSGFLFLDYEIKKQKEWNRWLAAYLGFDFSRGVLAESEHPFTTSLHKDDVRITNHYFKNNLESGIFSVIHETGHALFEQGNDDRVTQTPVSGGSCGVHESQSRLYENIIGRSRAFWEPLYPRLVKFFPDQLGRVSPDQFLRAINRVEPGLIRTESDELTYCLHIMIRYELEKKLIGGTLPVSGLPEQWGALYETYLGVRPEDDGEGVLQDIHWAMGEFGYFPSYALGNAMASQIYFQMEKEYDVEKLLRNQEMGTILAYLRMHIHKYGASKTMDELLTGMTGEGLNPGYYIRYLEDKYRTLYGL